MNKKRREKNERSAGQWERKEKQQRREGGERGTNRQSVIWPWYLFREIFSTGKTFAIIICLLDVEQWLYSFSPQILEIYKINKTGEFIISFYKFLEIVSFFMLFRKSLFTSYLLRWASEQYLWHSLISIYLGKKVPWLLSFLNSMRILDSLPRLPWQRKYKRFVSQ